MNPCIPTSQLYQISTVFPHLLHKILKKKKTFRITPTTTCGPLLYLFYLSSFLRGDEFPAIILCHSHAYFFTLSTYICNHKHFSHCEFDIEQYNDTVHIILQHAFLCIIITLRSVFLHVILVKSFFFFF